ncbi:MAG: YraN family protein [Proteobacteria bacterium]|nr:YraN family protein [Pseudomonadota bacterium]
MQKSPLQLARWGEDFVANYFIERDFSLLTRNYRRRGCELDLVLYRGDHLIILEVKARALWVEDLQSLAPPRKLKALFRGLQLFLQEHPQWAHKTIHLGLAVVSGMGTSRQSLQWLRLPFWQDSE